MTTLTATSPEVQRFLTAWHENGRAGFHRDHAWSTATVSCLVYDAYKAKRAVEKTRWICCDYGPEGNWSGCFLVDRATGEVYTIKAYGRPNRKIGTLEGLTAEYEAATATYATA